MSNAVVDLGLNPSGFKSGLKSAVDDVKGFEKQWKNLGKLFAAGGLTGLAIGFFRAIVDYARESKDAVDLNTRAVEELGNGWDFITQKVVGWGVQTVGWLERGALAWAAWHGQLDLAATAFGKMEGPSKQLLEAQQKLTKATHDRELAESTGVNRTKLLYADLVKLLNERRSLQLGSVADLEKQVQIQEKLGEIAKQEQDDARVKAAFDKQNADDAAKWDKEQAQALQKHRDFLIEQKGIAAEIADLQEKVVNLRKVALLDATAQVDLDKVSVRLKEKEAELAERAAAAAAEERKQTEGKAAAQKMNYDVYTKFMNAVVLGGRSSDQIQQAGDSALQTALDQNKRKIGDLSNNPGSAFSFGNSIEITRLQNENSRIQKELDARNSLRADVNFLGVEGARRQYQGDPLLFDKLVEQFTQTQTETGKTNQLLGRLVTQLDPKAQGSTALPAATLISELNRGFATLSQEIKASAQ